VAATIHRRERIDPFTRRRSAFMHLRHSGEDHGPPTVKIKYMLEDPEGLTGTDQKEHELMAAKGEHLLEVAMEHGINIEHACGGVCACSTCHIYIEKGGENLSEATEAEEDRVEEAPGLQRNSRLSCQCVVQGDGPIVVRVPAWNRNAVKEVPH
jgi:2Fe-2S ferredoxin